MMESTNPLQAHTFVQHLLQHWRGSATVRGAASADEIEAFEQTYQVKLPDDFRTYLECADGFDQEACYQDQAGFNFWPLSSVRPVAEYDGGKYGFPEDRRYFLFCDYLDFCWGYAVSFKDSKVVMVGTAVGRPIPVAESFEDFIRMYLRDDALLYPQLLKEV